MLGRREHVAVRVDNEFVRHAGVEAPVAIGRLVEADHLDVDDFGDGKPIPENRLHQLPVVLQYRRLAGVETMGLGPAKAEPKAQSSSFRGFLLRPRIISYVE